MSDYHIRLYKNSDYEVARDLFAQGLLENTREAFDHALRLPRVWICMFLVFLIPLLTTQSIPLSILCVTLALALLWLCTRDLYSSYIQYCLSDDMKNIPKYYLERDGYCFWVAESSGQPVGIVAAVPSPLADQYVELKRLSVAESHRGKGVATALCRTLIDFARDRGCEAVVLDTTLAQLAAQRLYEKMGFKFIHTFYYPKITAKLTDFRFLTYQYDLPRPR
ncbi:putative N-acetyltransferase 8B [Bombina bombina]|uniref:putative N-acetyltransferase 8B n=1 Tax=Bombina bombina TaxID=8345 RepID=UPI00235A4A24|nr:putative N-acetyltransferase 8B [Bombina bombina]